MRFRILLLAMASLACVAVAATPVKAQPTSDGPGASVADVEARAEAYIEAIESRDFESFYAWYGANAETPISRADARAHFNAYVEQWGGISPFGILAPAENTLVIDAQAGNGGTVSVRFEFAPAPPHLVRSITPQYTPPLPPIEAPAHWDSLQDLVDAVRTLAGAPALAVGVYHRGQFESVVSGWREADGQAPVQINDGFEWASVGKSVSGSVIATLVEDGILRWDSTIEEILGAESVHEAYRSVPLWMLASHQAGVPPLTDFDMSFEEEIAALPGDDLASKRAAYIRQMLTRAPEYPPGASAQYSNGGYLVMGYLAEVATGERWEDLVEERILASLRLDHSSLTGDGSLTMVAGHMAAPDGRLLPVSRGGPATISRFIAPAGGVSGSIGDLTAFAATHLRGLNGEDTVLASAETIRQLHSQQAGQRPFNGEEYSFGWGDRCIIELPEGTRCRSHNGGNGFFFAQILIIPEHDLVLTMLANNTDMGVRALDPLFSALFERHAASSGRD